MKLSPCNLWGCSHPVIILAAGASLVVITRIQLLLLQVTGFVHQLLLRSTWWLHPTAICPRFFYI